nr:hypothetical protein [Tanacetum cinerariifolium]
STMEETTIAQLNPSSRDKVLTAKQTIHNSTSLRFRKFTNFDGIPTTAFPDYYLSFDSYNQLESRVLQKDEKSKMRYSIVTDYIWCVRSASDIIRKRDPNKSQYMRSKIDIENLK